MFRKFSISVTLRLSVFLLSAMVLASNRSKTFTLQDDLTDITFVGSYLEDLNHK